MRNIRSWKHNGKRTRKVWGSPKENKRLTLFMIEDVDIDTWESEIDYTDTDDGIEEE